MALELSGRVPRKSKADFIAKLGTVIEEADESDFWLELTERADLVNAGANPTAAARGE